MLDNPDMLTQITSKIEEIGDEYAEIQGMILSEDDLRCHLFRKLLEIPYLRESAMTRDKPIKAARVHAEIPWFDEASLLKIKPDITILEPCNLSILHAVQGGEITPTKGFHFIGNAIVFELKFFKEWVGVSEAEAILVRRDFVKIKRLFKMMRDRVATKSLYCFIIVFAKTDRVCSEFKELCREVENEDGFKLVYKTASIPLPDRRIRTPSQW